MTATLDKTSDSWFHDFVLETFGLTPFVNTFPDFMAGGAVMITALFIAAGMEVSQTTATRVFVYKSCGEAWSRWLSSLERESECAEVCL